MSRKYFGTDGIRGTVGEEPLTAEFALRLASAVGRVLAPEGGKVAIAIFLTYEPVDFIVRFDMNCSTTSIFD